MPQLDFFNSLPQLLINFCCFFATLVVFILFLLPELSVVKKFREEIFLSLLDFGTQFKRNVYVSPLRSNKLASFFFINTFICSKFKSSK